MYSRGFLHCDAARLAPVDANLKKKTQITENSNLIHPLSTSFLVTNKKIIKIDTVFKL